MEVSLAADSVPGAEVDQATDWGPDWADGSSLGQGSEVSASLGSGGSVVLGSGEGWLQEKKPAGRWLVGG